MFSAFSLFCQALLSMDAADTASVEERPFLVLHKSYSASSIVEKDYAAVSIIVENVGNAAAYQVHVVDEMLGDKYGKEIEKIDPGQAISVGYRKKLDAALDMTVESATAYYHLDLEENSKVYQAHSTVHNEELPGELNEKEPIIQVLTSREYSKKHRYYAMEISTAVFFIVLATLFPLMIYKKNTALLKSTD